MYQDECDRLHALMTSTEQYERMIIILAHKFNISEVVTCAKNSHFIAKHAAKCVWYVDCALQLHH